MSIGLVLYVCAEMLGRSVSNLLRDPISPVGWTFAQPGIYCIIFIFCAISIMQNINTNTATSGYEYVTKIALSE